MLSMIPPAALGLAIGILLNYLADVLPRDRRLSHPACPHCGEDVPVRYYLIWPQRCTSCRKVNDRRVRSLAVVMASTLVTVWLDGSAPIKLGFPLSFLLAAYFILIVVIDVEHRLILFPTVIAGLILGAAAGIALHGIQPTILGGIAGYVTMFLLYKFGELFARIVSKRRGETLEEVALGYGDVNLAGVLGLILGWPVVFLGLILTILIGGLAGLLIIVAKVVLRRYRSFDAMPYAPYLIAATSLIVFFPEPVRQVFSGLYPLFGLV